MDPVTLIVMALATGAAAGLKPTAEQAVKDAYVAVKTLIQSKYSKVDLVSLENKPESQKKQDSLAEDLTDAGAANDLELLDRAKALADAVRTYDPSAARAVGVDLEAVEAEYLNVRKVISEGTGVKVKNSKFTGGINIEGVQVGKVNDIKNP